jgi:hypothetical protein
VLFVLSILHVLTLGDEKRLQGHLKRTLNHKNYQQKITKLFAVLKDSEGQFWKVKLRAKFQGKDRPVLAA